MKEYTLSELIEIVEEVEKKMNIIYKLSELKEDRAKKEKLILDRKEAIKECYREINKARVYKIIGIVLFIIFIIFSVLMFIPFTYKININSFVALTAITSIILAIFSAIIYLDKKPTKENCEKNINNYWDEIDYIKLRIEDITTSITDLENQLK